MANLPYFGRSTLLYIVHAFQQQILKIRKKTEIRGSRLIVKSYLICGSLLNIYLFIYLFIYVAGCTMFPHLPAPI
jgi:hypothetical protein